MEIFRVRRSVERLIIATFLAILAGCGARNGPLTDVDVAGRDPAKVEADKLTCLQLAEAEAGGAHSRTRWMIAPIAVSVALPAANNDALAARDQKIERDAEACMVQRGYSLRRT